MASVLEYGVEPQSGLARDDGRRKITLEFEVVRRESHGYGLYSYYLSRDGRRMPFKAIIREDEDGRIKDVVAIVGSRYEVLPNEAVLETVRKHYGNLIEEVRDEGYRIYVLIYPLDEEKKIGAVVRNSIDGTLTFGVDILKKIGVNTAAVFRVAYKMHTNSIREVLAELPKLIEKVVEEAKKVDEVLWKARGVTALQDDYDFLEQQRIPKKYLFGVKTLIARGASVFDIYALVARRIWSENLKMFTKYTLYRYLNEWLMLRTGMEV